MTDMTPLPGAERPSPVPLLVTALIETPCLLARRVAQLVTLAGLAVALLAALKGDIAGSGLVVFYASSAWALCSSLRRRSRMCHDH